MTIDLSYTIVDGTMRDVSIAGRMVNSALETAIDVLRGDGRLRVSSLSITVSGSVEVPDGDVGQEV